MTFEYEVEERGCQVDCIGSYRCSSRSPTSEVKFDISPNEEGKNRQGRIVFNSGALKSTVTVYQEEAAYCFPKEEYTVSSGGGEIVIELRSNVDYEMVLPMWIG